MHREVPWPRIGIEAWWQGGRERKAAAELRELLRVQMTANAEMLDEEVADALEARA